MLLEESNKTDPESAEVTNCYFVMKLFGVLDVGFIANMYEGTFMAIVEEITKDPEFKPADSKGQTKREFLG